MMVHHMHHQCPTCMQRFVGLLAIETAFARVKAAEVKKLTNQATHVLVFEAELPPVGYNPFTATRGGLRNHATAQVSERRSVRTGTPAADVVVANDMFELTFDTQTGMLSKVRPAPLRHAYANIIRHVRRR